MRVLLLGATGNLGSRLVPALLAHNHAVTAYVRNPTKLRSSLPADVVSKISIVEGDATSSATIKNAILEHDCDAVVNSAGLAAAMPWQHSQLPDIVKAVVDAATEVHETTGEKLRCWFLGGICVMDYPGKNGSMIVDYVPIYREHVRNIKLLESLPSDSIAWSVLCPAMMVPASKDGKATTADASKDIMVSATTPPGWKDSWVCFVPLLGNALNALSNMMSATTTLEANADFIAADLESGSEEYVRKRVAPIRRAKTE